MGCFTYPSEYTPDERRPFADRFPGEIRGTSPIRIRSKDMQKRSGSPVGVALLFVVLAAGPSRAAENYAVDPVHSGVHFKISHFGLSWIYGRFDDFSGNFTIDPDD